MTGEPGDQRWKYARDFLLMFKDKVKDPPPELASSDLFCPFNTSVEDGWMEGWMDGWMDGWRDGWMEGWMDGWKNGRMEGWMDGWMDRPTEEWMDGRTDKGLHE